MQKSKEEILKSITDLFPESMPDSAVSLMEDITDSFTDEQSVDSVNKEWQAKYNQLDATWKEKYTKRFYTGTPDVNISNPTTEEQNLPQSFDDLFK